ncbi:prephenate dehydrogenase [Actinocorallia lasiicapitis]
MQNQRVVVVGTGLIGTSVALAVRESGAEVFLADRDAASLALAVGLGAGTPLPDRLDRPADLAVIAVPPAAVAATLKDLQKRGVARFFTDVASVKARPVLDALRLGCDLTTYVPGHPLAGRERSGPAAARGDLFLGRPWALCPTEAARPEAIAAVETLARTCGAEIMVIDPVEHDRAMALVSHGPHVVSAAMAARLGDAPDAALALAGQGVRDVTRIAGSDPALWIGILTANADAVASVLDEVAGDLALAAAMLRASHEAEADVADVIMQRVGDLLTRGNRGRSRIPGKHGGRPSHYALVSVLVPDEPGELARLFQAVGDAGVNIEDLSIEHSPGLPLGVAELSVKPEVAETLVTELRDRGWSVPLRSEES